MKIDKEKFIISLLKNIPESSDLDEAILNTLSMLKILYSKNKEPLHQSHYKNLSHNFQMPKISSIDCYKRFSRSVKIFKSRNVFKIIFSY